MTLSRTMRLVISLGAQRLQLRRCTGSGPAAKRWGVGLPGGSWMLWTSLVLGTLPPLMTELRGSEQDSAPTAQAKTARVVRLAGNPIIRPSMLAGSDGDNINGPSVIRVPAWVRDPLGKYYLYFGHHRGKYIRMAYSDGIEGPYKVYGKGVLQMAEQRLLRGHIASPDVIVDDRNREILLYYHGAVSKEAKGARFDEQPGQVTTVAVSGDGVHFKPLDIIVGPAYIRMLQYRDCWYALSGAGRVFRARNLKAPFEMGHEVIDRKAVYGLYPQSPGDTSGTTKPWSGREAFRIRHGAVDVNGSEMVIYFTCVGHRPERIYRTTCRLEGDWTSWKAEPKMQEVLRPEEPWEGAALPLDFSRGGPSPGPENALRDPCIFKERNKTYLLYSVMGEHGIAIARLE